jgi:heat shock protein HslJ
MKPMRPDLQGAWTVTSYWSGEVMVVPDEGSQPHLVIDGSQVSGTMGINRFAGQYEGDAAFGALAVTRMAGPPDLMLQEDILLEHLQSADTVEVSDDGMFMRRDGLLLMELERSGTIEVSPTS